MIGRQESRTPVTHWCRGGLRSVAPALSPETCCQRRSPALLGSFARGFSVSRGVNDELDGSSEGSLSRQMQSVWKKTPPYSRRPLPPVLGRLGAHRATSGQRSWARSSAGRRQRSERITSGGSAVVVAVVVNDSTEIKLLPEDSAFLMGSCSQASLERAIASHQYFWQF